MSSPSLNTENLIEVPITRLEKGMYVAALDKPWLETPFAVQGFYIRGKRDIEALARYCEFAYVDPRRTNRGHTQSDLTPKRGLQRLFSRDSKAQRKSDKITSPRSNGFVSKPREYTDGVSMKEEFLTAETHYVSATESIARVFDEIRKGRALNLTAMAKAISPLIDSVLRNKDALAALIRIKKKDNYTYNHSLSVAVWSAIIGRHLGLDKDTLKALALGGSLIDVGKLNIDDALLSKPQRLTENEFNEIKQHVQYSMDLVNREGRASPLIMQIIATHHERHDGSGYPEGLSGRAIPLLGRIVSLADSYDAMITPRPYAPARSSFEAMQELSDLRDSRFQPELVEQFMQAVGLFPTGSLVELTTGEVAIVVAQNPTRRLKPKVIVILDANKKRHNSFVTIDLQSLDFGDESSRSIWITRELEVGAYGIEPEDYYL